MGWSTKVDYFMDPESEPWMRVKDVVNIIADYGHATELKWPDPAEVGKGDVLEGALDAVNDLIKQFNQVIAAAENRPSAE